MILEGTIDHLFEALPRERADSDKYRRLLRFEDAGVEPETKAYPDASDLPVFALIWRIYGGQLSAAIFPEKQDYCCHYAVDGRPRSHRHTHDYIELAYVVSGRFRQRIFDKDVTFKAGELCLVDKNSVHQDYLDTGDATVIFLGLSPAIFDQLEASGVVGVNILSFLQSALLDQKNIHQYLHFKPMSTDDGAMEGLMASLLSELFTRETGAAEICTGLMLRIFHRLGLDYEFSLSKEMRKTVNWMVFESVIEYMKAHYREVTLGELSEVFHFQEDYFNRLIKSKTGMTYSVYLQQIRLEAARQMLISGEPGIDDIVRAAGYHNKGYFYKLFKEKYGETPKRYRDRYGERRK